MNEIPLHYHSYNGNELRYLADAIQRRAIAADGVMTEECQKWFYDTFGINSILTHSCTAALEMTALLLNIENGDEVILPSYTHPSTANAFILRGAKLVFVDVDPGTYTISLDHVSAVISRRTRAIVPVHYAGVSCDMDALCDLAKKEGVALVEDAAHAMNASYKDKPLGTMGDFGCFSFHETKNISSGEGGMLSVNNKTLMQRALYLRDKGTNRSQFITGEASHYCWVDYGSSYGPSELTSAVLLAQLERVKETTIARNTVCNRYREMLSDVADTGMITLPVIPSYARTNGHQFHITLKNITMRNNLMSHLKALGIASAFHFVPLHCSYMGEMLGYAPSDLPETLNAGNTILRLPCFAELSEEKQERITTEISRFVHATTRTTMSV